MTEQYEATLYALGAIPVSELDREYWSDEARQAVYFKGERVDVNGWLSPYWAKSGSFLTDAEKKRYGIPKERLTYAEYVSLLDVEAYRRTKHPLQYTIMLFVLENMMSEGIKIENCDDIIRVYEAGIGLKERALPLLKRCLNSDQAMQLYNRIRDARLLDVFPVPRPEEENYIEFLRTLAEREHDRGWFALRLLYAMDKAAYTVAFRDFMIQRVRETDSLGEHIRMYRALVEIGDKESLESLAASLLSDPITEGREAIIDAAITANVCSKELVDSVVLLAQGLGEEHKPVTPSRMADQWQYTLREYLMWVRDNDLCDAETRTEAESALELLKR